MAMTDLIARLGLDTANFERGMRRADTAMGKFKKSVRGLGGFLGVGGFAAISREAINLGSRLDDTSKKLGVTTEFLQSFGYAARETGTSTESAEMGLQRFTRRLAEAQQGTGELLPILEQYGIELRNVDGTMRTANEVLRDYANAVRDAENPQERLRMAFKAFDSEGAGLVQVLAEGADGLDTWTSKAREAGQVMSEDVISQLAKAENNLDTFKQKVVIAVGTMVSKFTELGEAIGTALGNLVYNPEGVELEPFRKQAEEAMKSEGMQMGSNPMAMQAWGQEVNRRAKQLRDAEKAHQEQVAQDQKEVQQKQEAATDEQVETAEVMTEGTKRVSDEFVEAIDAQLGAIKTIKDLADDMEEAIDDTSQRYSDLSKELDDAGTTGGSIFTTPTHKSREAMYAYEKKKDQLFNLQMQGKSLEEAQAQLEGRGKNKDRGDPGMNELAEQTKVLKEIEKAIKSERVYQ